MLNQYNYKKVEEDFIYEDESYRDKLATVGEDGKRIWIFPKKPKGWFFDMRKYVSWGLLAVLFGLPFIKVNGDPLLLLNVLERHFIIFGVHFTPQDFHLFVLAMLTFVVFIVLFTVIFGRLFCGWVCPQTIFMEMVFRRIEYWIEGDSNAQRKLANAPWTTDKITKRLAKHTIFLAISILIAHTFLSYIIGLDEVVKIVTSSPSENMGGFMAMIAFTAAFYGVFTRLREQVCTTICPYGRLQGVLTDDNTILVSYDFVRGEPRGRISKKRKAPKIATPKTEKSGCNCTDCGSCSTVKTEPNPLEKIQSAVTSASEKPESVTEKSPIKLTGDCIDCKLCVQVCPTGIDIRDGAQLECVNCTACIDACDEVMIKVKRPTGLIRYDSHNGIKHNRGKLFTTRVKAYSVVLIALLSLNLFLLGSRSDVETVVLRSAGTLYQETDDNTISNLYNFQIFNKTGNDMPITLKIKGGEATVRLIGHDILVPKNDMAEGVFFIDMKKENIETQKTKLFIEVYSGDKRLETTKTTFLSPAM